MAYVLEEQYSSPNYTLPNNCVVTFGYARVIDGYTYHHWDTKDSGATYEGTIRTLCNDYRNVGSRGVSAHFVAESGRIACLVSPVNAAWHAGNGKGNATTIGIECNPLERGGDYATIIEFQAWLFARYGVKPLYHHCDWTPTECPGTYELQRIYDAALALFHKNAHSEPIVAPVPAAHVTPPVKHNLWVPDLHWEVDKGNTLSTIAAYYKVTVDQLAHYNGIRAPYIIKPGERIWPPSAGIGTWTDDPGEHGTMVINKAAKWFNVSADKIRHSNGINNDNTVVPGLRLNIPH